jgi:hypothetical protein
MSADDDVRGRSPARAEPERPLLVADPKAESAIGLMLFPRTGALPPCL